MITVEQAEVLRDVMKRFRKGDEDPEWTTFDSHMENLAVLADYELVHDANMQFQKDVDGNARCTKNHPREECAVPMIIEAMAYILDDYDETKRLVKTTRYMLEYYLALGATGQIITD